jgi:hypothetical protein
VEFKESIEIVKYNFLELKRISEDKLKALLADDKENEVVINEVSGHEDE